ncbi:hypothetical protein TNCV_4318131 [Trichonephila clavipes]|nr:hypothetical protein TNCV_4318131 [Trichonephila clavipes]
MPDKARLHTVRLVDNFLEAETMQRIEGIACSPNLTPIKHVWDLLGRCVAASPRPVTWRRGGSDFVKRGTIFPQISSLSITS